MNLVRFLNNLKKQTSNMRIAYEKRRLIDYYDTINQDIVSIPSFILADQALEEKYGVNYGK